MKKYFARLALIGAVAAAAVAVFGYVRSSSVSNEEVVQISFDDSTEHSLGANTIEAQEFTDIARKLVEIGV